MSSNNIGERPTIPAPASKDDLKAQRACARHALMQAQQGLRKADAEAIARWEAGVL